MTISITYIRSTPKPEFNSRFHVPKLSMFLEYLTSPMTSFAISSIIHGTANLKTVNERTYKNICVHLLSRKENREELIAYTGNNIMELLWNSVAASAHTQYFQNSLDLM